MNDRTTEVVKQAAEATLEAAEEVVRHPWIRRLARFGFYTKGFLFVLMGILAIAVVIGERGEAPDPRGALATIATSGFGRLILIAFVAGAAGHGVWNLLRAAADVDGVGSHWRAIVVRSVQSLAGFFYLGLAISAAEIVINAEVDLSHSAAEETFTSIALSVPVLGVLFIGLVGIGVIIAGIVECYNGVCGRFRENYRIHEVTRVHRLLINALGLLSFTVRAVLLVLIGYLFLRAVFYDPPGTSIGIDAALHTLRDTSFGGIMLITAAAGLVAHGVLAFYEASYRRIS